MPLLFSTELKCATVDGDLVVEEVEDDEVVVEGDGVVVVVVGLAAVVLVLELELELVVVVLLSGTGFSPLRHF